MPKHRSGLSPKEAAFVESFFLVKGNATQAAIRAGYSRKSARQLATRLLSKVHIQRAIAKTTDDRRAKGLMAAEERDLLLSDFARRNGAPIKERIRAVDLLNKTEGRYSSTLNVRDRTYEDILAESRKPVTS